MKELEALPTYMISCCCPSGNRLTHFLIQTVIKQVKWLVGDLITRRKLRVNCSYLSPFKQFTFCQQ